MKCVIMVKRSESSAHLSSAFKILHHLTARQGYFEADDWYMVTSPAFQVGLKSCVLNHPDEVGAPIVGVDLLDLCLLITLICRLASTARTAIWPRAGEGALRGELGAAHYQADRHDHQADHDHDHGHHDEENGADSNNHYDLPHDCWPMLAQRWKWATIVYPWYDDGCAQCKSKHVWWAILVWWRLRGLDRAPAIAPI